MAAEIPRRGEPSRGLLLYSPHPPLVVLQSRVRAGASYFRGRKIGRLSNCGLGQGRRIDGGRGRRRALISRQEEVDILRVDHQDDRVLDVVLPRVVQLDQNAAGHLVEQRQTKYRSWRKKIFYSRAWMSVQKLFYV